MPWPLSQDYNEAIQNPATCFTDAELRLAEAKCNAIGLPMPRSGNFADVYEMIGSGGKKWAVKCFTRHVSGLRERYAAISAYLKQANLPFMVDFSYLEQGIQVKGQWYPILKMDWVEGFTLNEFIGQNADNPGLLQATADIWLKVARRLREARMAHCDLQHGNVLLVPGKRDGALSVRLIDYDGMFVPALANTRSGEVGHAAFQHPQRLREAIYNGEVDRFPHLVIYTALRSLIVCGSSLWKRYDNGDNLLFRQQDLSAPGQSPLVRELIRVEDAELRRLLDQLSRSVHKPLEQTPLLDELASPSGASGRSRGRGRASGQGRRRNSGRAVLVGLLLLLGLMSLAVVGIKHLLSRQWIDAGPEAVAMAPAREGVAAPSPVRPDTRPAPTPAPTPPAETPSVPDSGAKDPAPPAEPPSPKPTDPGPKPTQPGPEPKDPDPKPRDTAPKPSDPDAKPKQPDPKPNDPTPPPPPTQPKPEPSSPPPKPVAPPKPPPVRSTSRLVGQRATAFQDVVAGQGMLVGFQVSTTRFFNGIFTLRSVRPIYLTPEGKKVGAVFGEVEGSETTVEARDGFAVGGLVGRGAVLVDGFKVVFMRINGDVLDPTDSYESPWVGGRGGGEAALGGDGKPVVGIHGGTINFGGNGRVTHSLSGIGLIQYDHLATSFKLVCKPPAPPPPAPPKAPVPDLAAQENALKTIKQLYQRDYLLIKTSNDRKALADKLLQKAQQTTDDAVGRFVMLREARDLCSQSGDITRSMTAIDRLAGLYAVDALDMKVAVMTAANKIYTSVQNSKLVVNACLDLLGEAVAADNAGAAQRLLVLAEDAAKRTFQKSQTDRVQMHVAQVADIQAELDRSRAAEAILAKQPDDPNANLICGKFLCLRKGDWQKGLPLLARGTDPVLRELARKDLAGPTDAEEHIVIADGWWALAQTQQGQAKTHLLRRAGAWYKTAISGLNASARARAEGRSTNVLEAGSTTASPGPSPPRPRDRLLEGSIWRGTITQRWEPGPQNTRPAVMTILDRSGSGFTARLDVNNGENVRVVTGTITEAGIISWPSANVRLEKGTGKGFDHVGRIQGDKIELAFTGINTLKQRTAASYTLALASPGK